MYAFCDISTAPYSFLSSPYHKGLVPVNGGSVPRISLLSNRCVFSVCPALNKPSKLSGEEVTTSKNHFLLCIDVDAKVKSLVGAVAPENELRPLLAVRRDLPHDHHLLPVVAAEADALELHHRGQGGVVNGEL